MARTMADAFNQYHQGYVKPQVESKVGKNSPAFTGTPTAPTADNDTDSTQIATTEFCQNLIRRLCGVDTKTIALLADLADALLNQPDFRDAVVTVLGNKLDKTDAATTYATKSELSNVSIDTSNFAKLNKANNFQGADNRFNSVISLVNYPGCGYTSKSGIFIGDYEDSERRNLIRYSELRMATTAFEISFFCGGSVNYVTIGQDNVYIRLKNTFYYFKEDGIYKDSTKIA